MRSACASNRGAIFTASTPMPSSMPSIGRRREPREAGIDHSARVGRHEGLWRPEHRLRGAAHAPYQAMEKSLKLGSF